ncbi:MAG: hypothetical protein ACWA5A_11615 [Marinibacterium sp.]
MSSPANPDVTRRRVFYIPGFDPMPPRKYRELYRREGARQAAISGFSLELAAPPETGNAGWNVRTVMHGAETHSSFEVLIWSDLVRDSMGRSLFGSYIELARTAWIYLGDGTLFRLFSLRKGPVIAALYPVVMMLVYLGLAAAGGVLLTGLVAAAGLPRIGAGAAGLIGAVALLRLARAMDGRTFVFYLMHLYGFTASGRGAFPPRVADRLSCFADRIRAAMGEDVDEVLVVGHSLGAHLAIVALSDAMRGQTRPATGPALGLLTLGQVVPMVSFLKAADRLRGDLAWLAGRDDLTWVDVSAPGDGGSFALCDPVAVSGVAPPGRHWPLVISAAFSRTLSAARQKALRWRFHRLHFQYLCAFDRPGDYDYFRVTAGPRSLAARFCGRSPSQSRIVRATSKYASVAS